MPGNTRRGRPQGKCHRKQTAGSGLGPPARVKGCGKSAPRPRQRGRQGKPHREQDQVGTARRGLVRQGPRNRQAGFRAAVRVGRARRPVTGVPDEWPSSASADTEPGLQAVWRLPFRRRVVPNAGFPRRERTETSGIAEDGLIPRGAERLQNSRRTSAHLGALGVKNNSNAEDAEEPKGTTRDHGYFRNQRRRGYPSDKARNSRICVWVNTGARVFAGARVRSTPGWRKGATWYLAGRPKLPTKEHTKNIKLPEFPFLIGRHNPWGIFNYFSATCSAGPEGFGNTL